MPVIMVSSKNKVSMLSIRRKKKVIIHKRIIFKSSTISYVAIKVAETVVVVLAVAFWNSFGKGPANKPQQQQQFFQEDPPEIAPSPIAMLKFPVDFLVPRTFLPKMEEKLAKVVEDIGDRGYQKIMLDCVPFASVYDINYYPQTARDSFCTLIPTITAKINLIRISYGKAPMEVWLNSRFDNLDKYHTEIGVYDDDSYHFTHPYSFQVSLEIALKANSIFPGTVPGVLLESKSFYDQFSSLDKSNLGRGADLISRKQKILIERFTKDRLLNNLKMGLLLNEVHCPFFTGEIWPKIMKMFDAFFLQLEHVEEEIGQLETPMATGEDFNKTAEETNEADSQSSEFRKFRQCIANLQDVHYFPMVEDVSDAALVLQKV